MLALTSVTGVMPGCAGKQPRGEEKAEAERSPDDSSLRESIFAQVGKSPCESSSVCRTIPLGAKPCGGPQEYLIYSTSATDSVRLAREVARYNEAEHKRNREEGRMSDCMAVERPRVSCVSGQCRAVTAGHLPRVSLGADR
jgi:hypothetical protein